MYRNRLWNISFKSGRSFIHLLEIMWKFLVFTDLFTLTCSTESYVLNTFWLPKYKSKIERKIDALLTITDTLCTHIYPRATSITLPLPMLFNVLFSFYCYRGAIRFFLLLERKCPEKRNLVFGACATVFHDSYTPTPSYSLHVLILFRCFVTP